MNDTLVMKVRSNTHDRQEEFPDLLLGQELAALFRGGNESREVPALSVLEHHVKDPLIQTPQYVKQDLMYIKRDPLCVKRDLQTLAYLTGCSRTSHSI